MSNYSFCTSFFVDNIDDEMARSVIMEKAMHKQFRRPM